MRPRQEINLARVLIHREVNQRNHASPGCSSASDCSLSFKSELGRWAESDFLQRCSAAYCRLGPAARSTIAASFSTDGNLLASTHGDHTVKIIDVQQGKCIRTLQGHQRTPWVVHFHPHTSSLLASGSLDHVVRLWNANTGECVNLWNFGRPIASLAFHSQGNVLAVASGHKLYVWEYNKGVQDSGAPAVCLRTRKSLRAVNFQPHGGPLLLTAEVNDPEHQEYHLSIAVSMGRSSGQIGDPSRGWEAAYTVTTAAAIGNTSRTASGNIAAPGSSNASPSSSAQTNLASPMPQGSAGASQGQHGRSAADGDGGQPGAGPQLQTPQVSADLEGPNREGAGEQARAEASGGVLDRLTSRPRASLTALSAALGRIGRAGWSGDTNNRRSQLPPTMVPMGWELPADNLQRDILQHQQATEAAGSREAGGTVPETFDERQVPVGAEAGSVAQASAEAVAAATAAAAAIVGQEQPCTVKLKLWHYDASKPRQQLTIPRLIIPHTVLCSEMGVHFSPCGRYLAACVACRQPPADEPHGGSAGAPSSAAGPIFELRVISMAEDTFGQVLKARQIRAAHCLTSIQFSPASDHLLLAYGRRHISLLRSLVADGGSIIPVHTILEVYRVSDMSLVRVLPSAEDEVNVAAFHPCQGAGIVYGTKEGRLRILRHDRTPLRLIQAAVLRAGRSLEDELLEADRLVDSRSESDEESYEVV